MQISKSEKFLAFGFWNPRKFPLSNLESWALESGIQLKESGIPLTTKFRWQRLESIFWNPESTAWNPESKTVLDSLNGAIGYMKPLSSVVSAITAHVKLIIE